MTSRERLERKLEKRQEWAKGRKSKAEQDYTAAMQVPLPPDGEPIKVGHHSEKRHRSAIAKVDRLMSRSLEHTGMAEHHESKAEGLGAMLDGSIFDDDPDAIQKLEQRIAEREAKQGMMKAVNKIIRSAPKYRQTTEKIEKLKQLPGLDHAKALELFGNNVCKTVGFSPFDLQNNNASINRDRKRLQRVRVRQERAAHAADSGGVLIEKGNGYARVTFEEKPGRGVLNELKAAGFRWGKGSWVGKANSLPGSLRAKAEGGVK